MNACIYTIADKNNEWMVPYLRNSLRKFHSEEELPLIVYGEEELIKNTDPNKFYRATPYYAMDLLDKFRLVIKMDVDSIVFGRLDYILNSEYDVGVVYNWNRADPLVYGEIGLATIHPQQYFNCGLVAMRDRRFVNNWWNLCNSHHFNLMPYREQGFLNILCHYGDYNVKCFDDWNPLERHSSWYGLASKSEWLRATLKDGDVVIPKEHELGGAYPDRDKVVKVIHWAGGSGEKKMAYHTAFNEEMIDYISWLVSESEDKYVKKA